MLHVYYGVHNAQLHNIIGGLENNFFPSSNHGILRVHYGHHYERHNVYVELPILFCSIPLAMQEEKKLVVLSRLYGPRIFEHDEYRHCHAIAISFM